MHDLVIQSVPKGANLIFYLLTSGLTSYKGYNQIILKQRNPHSCGAQGESMQLAAGRVDFLREMKFPVDPMCPVHSPK